MKLNLVILCGGRSGEHEVSLRSAESIVNALDKQRFEIRRIFISKEGKWDPAPILPEPGANPGIDVVFPVLHGTFGEDGTIQGLLELADLPYVGAGVLGSSASMDKEVTKRICRQAGLNVGDFRVVMSDDFAVEELESALGYPMFVKPANLGSSVGVSKAVDRAHLEAAIASARQYDTKVMVERTIVGHEVECAVLGNDDPIASTPCEILPSRDFYDYEDKYLLDKSDARIPADLPADRLEEVRRIAVAAFRALQCQGMARVDFLVERSTGEIHLNEVNTIPGFTSISMYPKMWEHCGVPYNELLNRLIDLALERHKIRQSLKFTR